MKKCGVYYLATMDGDQPRVRPFGTIDLFEERLYIQTGKVKAVANQLKANPKVELSAMSPDGQWIRIAAEAVLDENVAAQAHMLDAYPFLQAQYQPGGWKYRSILPEKRRSTNLLFYRSAKSDKILSIKDFIRRTP